MNKSDEERCTPPSDDPNYAKVESWHCVLHYPQWCSCPQPKEPSHAEIIRMSENLLRGIYREYWKDAVVQWPARLNHARDCNVFPPTYRPCSCGRDSRLQAEILRLLRAQSESGLSVEPSAAPIQMVLYCPACGAQHVDEPDERTPGWTNPPHRSHLCHACGCIWRPADVPTVGVLKIETVGKNDWAPAFGHAAVVSSANTSIDVATALQMSCQDIPREFAEHVDREFWNLLNAADSKARDAT